MSLTTSVAPARAQRLAIRDPTCPSPITATLRPRSDAGPEHPLAAGPDGRLHAERGERARIAGTAHPAWQPGHVPGALRDHPHVAARGADVLGGDVAAAERLHRVGEVEQRGAAQLAHVA